MPEPLEGGLPGRAEYLTDISPALSGGPCAVNDRLQRRLGRG